MVAWSRGKLAVSFPRCQAWKLTAKDGELLGWGDVYPLIYPVPRILFSGTKKN